MEAGVCACSFETANSLRIESGYILFANELARQPIRSKSAWSGW